MPGKFCVSLRCAKDNTDKATVAFVVANAAMGSAQETLVFLSTEGVRLGVKGYADEIHEQGFAPLKELMENFVKAGGTIYEPFGSALGEARNRPSEIVAEPRALVGRQNLEPIRDRIWKLASYAIDGRETETTFGLGIDWMIRLDLDRAKPAGARSPRG